MNIQALLIALSFLSGIGSVQPPADPPAAPASGATAEPPTPDQPADPPTAPPALSGHAAVEPAVFTARELTRLAMLDLRLSESPTPSDYRVCDLLLSLASDLTPDDPELARRRAEASWNSGHHADALEATRRLIRLDPSDTVAQLRLISALVTREQNADGRLNAYARYLGSGSERLDPALRSRLALDAAMLAREAGREALFRERLTQAISLDPSNKEAALLALSEFHHATPGDNPGRFEMLSNLLMADPIDPVVHLTLASELATAGVFDQASRWHRSGIALMLKSGTTPGQETEVETLVLAWLTQGPEKVAQQIGRDLEAKREQVRKYNERFATGIGLGADLGDPDDVRVDIETEKVRTSLAIAMQDEETLARSMTDMRKSVEYMFELAVDDKKRPIGISRNAALVQANSKFLDLQFWRALSGFDTDKIEADLDRVQVAAGRDQPGPELVRAIADAREGEAAEALERLGALLGRLDPASPVYAAAVFGRGLAHQASGQNDLAVADYRTVRRLIPMTSLGAMSRARAEILTGTPEPLSPDARRLEQLSAAIPAWVDRMVAEPSSYMTMLVTSPATSDPLSPATVTITLRNAASIPLALGPNRPINSRLLLAPTLTLRSRAVASLARPEVVDLDRRLRLNPRELIEAKTDVGLGFTGLLLDLTSAQQSQLEWRVLQGFLITPDGVFSESSTSLAARTRVSLRRPWVPAQRPAEYAAHALRHDPDVPAAAALGRSLLWAQELDAISRSGSSTPLSIPASTNDWAGERAAVAEAAVERWSSLTPMDKLALLSVFPHAGQFPELAPLDRLALDDPDTRVRALAVATRARDASDPALLDALNSNDPRLAELASLTKSRLEQASPCYPRLGPGLRALAGTAE
ncbi:MAG: hypothetical protein HRU70_01285 [Phycisphaeraceae bacterium]|nr:MAG: hypothetical protein HRU70_01285 [Phycisphaeraceae bacterium]